MQLKDVMTRQVEVISPDASLEEAARKMDQLNVGPLPVCENERLVGLVTDRDITVRATAAGKDPRTTPVREAMSQDVLYCFEDQDVREAAQIMENQQVRRLPVLAAPPGAVPEDVLAERDLEARLGHEGLRQHLSEGRPPAEEEPRS